jgi:tetratricopeptide (TPR) repeat protein
VRAQSFCKGGHWDEQRIADALADAEAALGLERSWQGYFARGYCYSEKNEFSKAISDLETALKLNPKNRKVENTLKSVREKSNKPH